MQVTIHFDGGARGNPGPAGAGVSITDTNGKVLFAGGWYLGEQTNNYAEYTGLINALEVAEQLGATALTVYSDSELLVRQINGHYRVKSRTLKPLYQQATDRIDRFETVTVEHVYREANKQADALVNQAIDARKNVIRTQPSSS